MAHAHHHFVPAAGQHWLLPFYDPFVALFTRERKWRNAILDALDLRAGDVLVDVGCGTGTLAVMAKIRVPEIKVIGVDPDQAALERATRKAEKARADIAFRQGFGSETAQLAGVGTATRAVSSMAFHHMPSDVQAETLKAMYDALAPGGRLAIADFIGGHFGGAQETSLVDAITTAGFERVRTVQRFRVAFSDAALMTAEKPSR